MLSETPCRYCNDRNATCHCYCEKYLLWRKELDELNAKIREKERISYLAFEEKKRRRR